MTMYNSQPDLFLRFGVALVIGILIGLERQHAAEERDLQIFAGVRTIPMLALAGCTGALLTDLTGSPWPLAATILCFGGLMIAAYWVLSSRRDFGATSEVAAMVAVLIGALCYYRYLALAAALAVTTTVLLSLKGTMHDFARHLSREDVYASLKFAVITAIVLPVLPRESIGPPPFDALNPYRIWLMVVFISGISYTGYVLMKVVNPRNGIGLTGFLGGMVSSTAVTLSFSQRSRSHSQLAGSFSMAITAAWMIMFVRVLVEVGVVNRALLGHVWLPLTAPPLVMGAYLAVLFKRTRSDNNQPVNLVNPFELGPALTFGALYALVLLVSRAAQIYFGNAGTYVSSVLAGLADVNAITISMAELSQTGGELAPETAANAIILAVLANTAVKGGVVLVTGSGGLRRAIFPSLLIGLIVTGAVALAV